MSRVTTAIRLSHIDSQLSPSNVSVYWVTVSFSSFPPIVLYAHNATVSTPFQIHEQQNSRTNYHFDIMFCECLSLFVAYLSNEWIENECQRKRTRVTAKPAIKQIKTYEKQFATQKKTNTMSSLKDLFQRVIWFSEQQNEQIERIQKTAAYQPGENVIIHKNHNYPE